MTRAASRGRALLLASLLLCACAEAGPEGPPSIVLVVLDTVRADAVSAYGRVEGSTPELDRLASQGILYERAYAQAPWTLPSHATLFSGLPPSGHGVSSRQPVAPRTLVMLAERLRTAGYDTAGISENPWIQPGTRLTQGFDRFRVLLRRTPEEAAARPAVAVVREWLEERETGRPFFLFLNFIDAHAPYRLRDENPFLPGGVSPAAAEALLEDLELSACAEWPADSQQMATLFGLYLGGLAAADAKLGSILRLLDEHAGGRRRITIVTSDHGEHFGEHDLRDHYFSLHEELLRIPLVVHGLGGPARITEPVALMDLVPSVLAWLERPRPEGLPGRPLPLEPGAARPARTLTASFVDPLAHPPRLGKLHRLILKHASELRRSCPADRPAAGDRRTAIRHPHKLLLEEGVPARLFDLSGDPGEARNLAGSRPELVGELVSQLSRLRTPPARGTAPDPAPGSLEALRALGYVHGED